MEKLKGFDSYRSNGLHMGTHAAADIEEQRESKRLCASIRKEQLALPLLVEEENSNPESRSRRKTPNSKKCFGWK